jgi:DNA-directed RNA polymerase subunit alpha
MQSFIKPEAVECNIDTLTETYGEFVIQPLERGWGTTIGNALRRVLLSSIEGSAITAVQIDKVLHEFTSIQGVKEDVTDIILNLKCVSLISYSDEPLIAKIKVKGPANVTAKNIEHDDRIRVISKDQYIATVNEEGTLNMQLIIQKGRGYVPSELNKTDDPLFVPIDSIFNPVKKVNFEVTQTRVKESTDYEKLKIEIWTNGTMLPQKSLERASTLLLEHLKLFEDIDNESAKIQEVKAAPKGKKEKVDIERILSQKIADQQLSKRVLNALESLEVKTIKDLVKMTEEDILKGRNVGQKAVSEINEFLEGLNLSLGMKV